MNYLLEKKLLNRQKSICILRAMLFKALQRDFFINSVTGSPINAKKAFETSEKFDKARLKQLKLIKDIDKRILFLRDPRFL